LLAINHWAPNEDDGRPRLNLLELRDQILKRNVPHVVINDDAVDIGKPLESLNSFHSVLRDDDIQLCWHPTNHAPEIAGAGFYAVGSAPILGVLPESAARGIIITGILFDS
jgi:hypothetical protein